MMMMMIHGHSCHFMFFFFSHYHALSVNHGIMGINLENGDE